MTVTYVIVGLGKSGFSCAQYFKRHGIAFAVMDANPAPAWLDELRALAPEAEFSTIDEERLRQADKIVLSPGVSRSIPEIRHAAEAGVPITGDVALFGELADAPVVAITGSNGKSTVTALVGEMAAAA
ncbi:MAG TPA: UDP-N-acetylmuramoyl-L-alanine--D-glutamate ligase, partial [Pseudomonadales bacterium]|nr:UDP-N-acetylmuramoyl-L-alanine--D-glutamate ligase [Pseudomonadales bacterium]